MRIAYLGNFSVPWTTETHIAASFEAIGCAVVRIQEGDTPATEVPDIARKADAFLWTQTYSLAEQGGTREQRAEMLDKIKAFGIVTVSFHLDRYWGLQREGQVGTEPWWKCDYVITADGGHDDKFRALNINHHWLPPGVYHGEAYDVKPQQKWASDLVFVGSWQHYGHEEHWPYRKEMLDRIRGWYGPRFKCWPNGRAIRGRALNTLYASCKLAIGDSCITGSPGKYWSDRSSETLGRGGMLIHPWTPGYDEIHPYVPTWKLGEWDDLHELIEDMLTNPAREELKREGAEDVRTNHTYRNRAQEILKLLA